MKPKLFLLLFATSFLTTVCFCQDSLLSKFSQFPARYLNKVSEKTSSINEKLTGKTDKTLRRMKRQEERIKSKLYKIDSLAANNLFSNSLDKYEEFQKKLNAKAEKLTNTGLGNYIPYLDSLKTTLNFLSKDGNEIVAKNKELQNKLKETIKNADELEARLDQLKIIQQYLRERKQYLKEQLEKYGLGKELKKMNKEVYYYGELLKDYKETLKDPKKIEQKALSILKRLPAFNRFMQRNSQLASIFGIPGDNNNTTVVSLIGLQTRSSVQQIIQNTVATIGPNAQQFIQQQLQTANNQLSQMKNKPAIFDLNGNMVDVPDFKPNNEKNKPFHKRLELGTNVQFGKTNGLLPTTGNFALSLGYKLNNNGTIGLGTSYKLGLGNGIQNIKFTHQGFGLRSYIDWKIKGNFFISGGYEKNYLPALENLSASISLNKWQESGLIGITKKYSIRKLKSSAQLLFDFLSYKNIPRSQPIIFRIGWSF